MRWWVCYFATNHFTFTKVRLGSLSFTSKQIAPPTMGMAERRWMGNHTVFAIALHFSNYSFFLTVSWPWPTPVAQAEIVSIFRLQTFTIFNRRKASSCRVGLTIAQQSHGSRINALQHSSNGKWMEMKVSKCRNMWNVRNHWSSAFNTCVRLKADIVWFDSWYW